MPLPEHDNQRAARALADAYFTTNKQAAAKHGISTRSIARYLSMLQKDASLSGLYDRLLEDVCTRPWADELSQTLTTPRKIGVKLEAVEADSLADITQLVGLTRELMERELSRKYAEHETRGDMGAEQGQNRTGQTQDSRLLTQNWSR